jgi:hypothetical protein
MATDKEVGEVMTLLAAAYPEQGSKLDPSVLEAQVNLYCEMLGDIDGELLRMAAIDHIKKSEWFPKISELRTRSESAYYRRALEENQRLALEEAERYNILFNQKKQLSLKSGGCDDKKF